MQIAISSTIAPSMVSCARNEQMGARLQLFTGRHRYQLARFGQSVMYFFFFFFFFFLGGRERFKKSVGKKRKILGEKILI